METEEIVTLKNAVSDQDHSQGPADAPVTLVEYGNFECIDCGLAFPSLKEVRRLLGDELRFVYRHFPSVKTHPHAMRAAEAAEGAGAQGRFWEMHDELFKHQTSLDDPHLIRYAKNVGLDAGRFARDLSEHSFLKRIQDDYQISLFDEHITGTPTIYMNGVRYTGLTDVESLLSAIKHADTENRIKLPASTGGLRRLIERLRQRRRGV